MPEVDRRAVRDRALRLLARREHSAIELTRKLTSGDADDAIVEAVVADLVARDLISDSRYAEAFVRDALLLKPRSRQRLMLELKRRGVAAALAGPIVDAVFEEEGVDDAHLARTSAQRYLKRLRDVPDEARWRRLGAHLQRRGFENALIYDLCQDLLPELET